MQQLIAQAEATYHNHNSLKQFWKTQATRMKPPSTKAVHMARAYSCAPPCLPLPSP